MKMTKLTLLEAWALMFTMNPTPQAAFSSFGSQNDFGLPFWPSLPEEVTGLVAAAVLLSLSVDDGRVSVSLVEATWSLFKVLGAIQRTSQKSDSLSKEKYVVWV